jgi:TRAP-type mannitol/chloroaromatic compound transport system permease small subunit
MESMKSAVLLSLLIASVLLFGGLMHALLPHDHGSHAVVTDLLHSAVHHEQKQFIDLTIIALLGVIPVLVLYVWFSREYFALRFARIRAQSSKDASLHSGIEKYRTFR